MLGYLPYRTAPRSPGFAPCFSLGQHPKGVNGGDHGDSSVLKPGHSLSI